MSGTEPILMLDREEVRSLLTWPELIDATQRALIDLAEGDALPSISSQLVVPGASLHLKAGALAAPPVISVKANLRPDAGSTSGAILVFDYERQRLHAIMSSGDLTAMRTAAIAAVAARALVGNGPVVVALLGAGPVAQRVDEALEHLGIAAEVRIWSRTRERAIGLATAYNGQIEHRVCDTIADAVRGADLVISCTPSRSPLVSADDLLPDAVLLAMGADSVGKRELAPGVLDTAEIYADVRQDALRVGECAYLDEEAAGRVSSIGAVLSAGIGSRPAGRRIVFDSVGSSAVDAAVVGLVVAQAAQRGLGHWFDLDGGAPGEAPQMVPPVVQ
jgi:ornithine cyclodeaminase/alanine dehydrogenase-like protein (mu-crystallin family)